MELWEREREGQKARKWRKREEEGGGECGGEGEWRGLVESRGTLVKLTCAKKGCGVVGQRKWSYVLHNGWPQFTEKGQRDKGAYLVNGQCCTSLF